MCVHVATYNASFNHSVSDGILSMLGELLFVSLVLGRASSQVCPSSPKDPTPCLFVYMRQVSGYRSFSLFQPSRCYFQSCLQVWPSTMNDYASLDRTWALSMNKVSTLLITTAHTHTHNLVRCGLHTDLHNTNYFTMMWFLRVVLKGTCRYPGSSFFGCYSEYTCSTLDWLFWQFTFSVFMYKQSSPHTWTFHSAYSCTIIVYHNCIE